jgi:nucleotide-binding universal stress UspA family protein
VVIGMRGRRLRRGGVWLAAKRWWSEHQLDTAQPARPTRQLERAPHLLVAVDTDDDDQALAEAMREALLRLIAHDPHWRITCVGVLEPSIMTEQEEGDAIGRTLHTAKLATLHQWAYPLALPKENIRFHVLTGGDAAAQLVDYARTAHADHIVMGARGSSVMRRYLGSVSARVVAEAPCSVTVVRVPRLQDV